MSTISKLKMIGEVIDKFIIKNITTISVDPDYESLNITTLALYENAATLPTTLDGVKHGNIGLITKDTRYVILMTVTPWEDPDDPGSSQTISKNDTATHHQQANETYG